MPDGHQTVCGASPLCNGLSRVRQAALRERQLRVALLERSLNAIIQGKSRMR